MLKTTPLDIAKEISSGLADSVVIAKVVYTNPSARGDVDDNIIACDEDEEASAESTLAKRSHIFLLIIFYFHYHQRVGMLWPAIAESCGIWIGY